MLRNKIIRPVWAGVCVLLVAVVAASCGGDRPRPFLKEAEMSELLTEIRLIEAHLYETREKNTVEANRVMLDRSLDLYVPVFKKYGIDYRQYEALMNYYMARPDRMEKILKQSADKLSAMREEAEK
ncbi:MAG: DUF4296 domain-containing protein [Bacteroidales bacterium]|nr:DUF4296 domain-containing protein [Bacteroidales bacterium]MDE7072690.1 DUF4296 domain-containing protein [Bacteroidales bacterium]